LVIYEIGGKAKYATRIVAYELRISLPK
jgi:hypothetical protein